MRGIISIVIVVIGMSLLTQKPDLKPRPNPVPFRFHPTHIQYIQDSIQRPIPQHPVRIMIHQYLDQQNKHLETQKVHLFISIIVSPGHHQMTPHDTTCKVMSTN